MAIDTDDLSRKTYKAIIAESEKFDENLTLQFGLLSYKCNDEEDFINKSKMLIYILLNYDEYEMDDMFFGEPPNIESFHKALHKILTNIATLKN